MPRPAPPGELEFPGSDSFLDVLTNIVGILIILVVIVGVRSRHAGVAAASSTNEGPLAQELAAAQADDVALSGELEQMAAQIDLVKRTTQARRQERGALATLSTAAEIELADRRAQLDDAARRRYDAQRDLALARADLEQIERRRTQLASVRSPVHQIESFPTPLAKTVDGKEVHYRLKGDRVAVVPLDELLAKFKTHVRERIWKLQAQSELNETIGPVDQFYLRYSIERREIPPDVVLKTGRSGTVVRLRRWELVPVTEQLGEPIDDALKGHSRCRAELDKVSPREGTVTLWVYPDSFDAFRRLRKELHAQGYAVAGRPLPDSMPIAGSPDGSKSAAE